MSLQLHIARARIRYAASLLVLCFMLATHMGWAQCANNNAVIAGGAITIPCPGSTAIPCIQAGQYALINVTAGNLYNFSLCTGTNFDSQITIFNNSGGGNLGSDDDGCGTFASDLSWVATFTGQLRVLVDEYVSIFNTCASNALCAEMTVTCTLPPPALTNDNPCGAIDLFVIENCFMQSFTNTGATTTAGIPAPGCGNLTGSSRDVWFRFLVPGSGIVYIDTYAGTLTDGSMAIYSAASCSGPFTLVECDANDGPGNMPYISRRCALLTPNTYYYLRFWGSGNQQGSFAICVYGPQTYSLPPEDCSGAATICGSQSFNNNTTTTGCTTDLGLANRGCLQGNERQGTWYYFSPSASGTIAFTIDPVANVDYDFAIWGPMSSITCPPVGNPIRCSWAYPPNVPGYPGAGAFLTGLGNGAADNSENQNGNGYVAPMNVIAGQIYILYIDNFDVTGQSFSLTWSLTNGASLDCTVLPVELVDLIAVPVEDAIEVRWRTVSELNSDRFEIERSFDGENFIWIGSQTAAGNSMEERLYLHHDATARQGMNYYRLRQVDLDGSFTYSAIVSAYLKPAGGMSSLVPNPGGEEVQISFAGDAHVRLLLYDATGRIVVERSLDGEHHVIDMGHLPRGAYSYRIDDAHGLSMGRGVWLKH